MKVNLKKIREELRKRLKAGPPSDYQDLWITMHDLLVDFETELRKELEENQRLANLETSPEVNRVYHSAKVALLKAILGEETSKMRVKASTIIKACYDREYEKRFAYRYTHAGYPPIEVIWDIPKTLENQKLVNEFVYDYSGNPFVKNFLRKKGGF